MNKLTTKLAGGLLVLGGGLMAAGCQQPVTADRVRSNPTPELESISMSTEQRKNAHARTVDTNLRQLWDDFDSVLFLDRPLRLSRYPIP